jgi:hypothetical protein
MGWGADGMSAVVVVVIVFLAIFLGGCAAQTYVIQTQLPGNNTLLVEHECGAAVCGNFIDTQETQP